MKSGFSRWLKVSTLVHVFIIVSFYRILIPVFGEPEECHPPSALPTTTLEASEQQALEIASSTWEEVLDALESLSQPEAGEMGNVDQQSRTVEELMAHLSGNTDLSDAQAQQIGQELQALSAIDAALQNALIDAIKEALENQPDAYHVSEKQLDQMMDELLRQLQGMSRQMQSENRAAQRLARLLNDSDMLERMREAARQQMMDQSLAELKEAVEKAMREAIDGKGKDKSSGDLAEGSQTKSPSASGQQSGSPRGQISSGAPSGSSGKGKEGENGNSQGKGKESGELTSSDNAGMSEQAGAGPLGDLPGRLETILGSSGEGLGSLPTGLSADELSQELAEAALAALEESNSWNNKSSRSEALRSLSAAIASGLALQDTEGTPGAPPAALVQAMKESLAEHNPLKELIKNQPQTQTAAQGASQTSGTGETQGEYGAGAPLQYDVATYMKHLEKIQNRLVEQATPARFGALAGSQQPRSVIRPETILTLARYRGAEEQPNPSLQQPSFRSNKYGAARRLTSPLTIDGSLDDWPTLDKFRLLGSMQGVATGGPAVAVENSGLMTAWDNRGLYVAYWIDDPADSRRMNMRRFWQGDALELFIDPQNLKNENRGTSTEYQYWIWPRHLIHSQSIGRSVFSGPRDYTPTPLSNSGIEAASLRDGSRYTCEAFIPLEHLDAKAFLPGQILGFNYSINKGENVYIRWVTNAGKNTALHPALWGDLLLMGSNATLSSRQKRILAGESILIQVTDNDMNLHPDKADNLNLTAVVQGGQYAIEFSLAETASNSGVFEGKLHTEYAAKAPQNNRLGVKPGDKIIINYSDQFAAGGRQDVDHTIHVPVARAMFRMVSGDNSN